MCYITHSKGSLFDGDVGLASEADITDCIPDELPVGLGLWFGIALGAIVRQGEVGGGRSGGRGMREGRVVGDTPPRILMLS